MCIKKVMWLWAMRRDNLTKQRTDLVHSIYKLWSFWKAWGKSVIKVFLYNYVTRLCSQTAASTSECSDSIYCYVCSLWGANNLYLIWKLLYSVASPIFLVIFSTTVYQEVTILFSLTCWTESVLYSHMHEWMNEWCIYIALLLCIAIHPKRFTIMWGVSPQPPPVCSIHLDDATAATGQRRQCAHHTPATGGEEREIEPIKLMGIIGRPWLTKASGGKLARTPGLHPYTLRWVPWDF